MNITVPSLNTCLIFQGYGSLSAYEAGVFKTLYENLSHREYDKSLFDIIIGTGMGAVNAAIVMSHVIENKTWRGSTEKLIEFWNYISIESITGKGDLLYSPEKYGEINPHVATEEEVRRANAAKRGIQVGFPDVSSPYIKTDIKFPENIWQQFDLSPLRRSIERFVKFPIASSFENGEPRLLLTSVDVAEGVAVSFDSYKKQGGSRNSIYGNKDREHAISYDDGIRIEHIMACLSYPPLYPYEYIDNRIFCTAGILSNSLLRELIDQHKIFWKHRMISETLGKETCNDENAWQKIPGLEVYVIDLWSAKLNNIPRDFGEITNRLIDIMNHGKLKYDEKVALVITDYIDLTKRLIGFVKKNGVSDAELAGILNVEADSKFRDGGTRTYKDLIEDAFHIRNYNIKRIERKEYLNSISNQWADFTIATINALIKEGERDAAHDLISGIDRTLEIIDKVSGQIRERTGDRRISQSSLSVEQKGNVINIKEGEQIVGTITSEKLKQLDIKDQDLIGTYEESMISNFEIWKEAYPQLSLKDGMEKVKLKLQIKDVINTMCKDLKNISNYLQSLGIHIGDRYKQIEYICQEASNL